MTSRYNVISHSSTSILSPTAASDYANAISHSDISKSRSSVAGAYGIESSDNTQVSPLHDLHDCPAAEGSVIAGSRSFQHFSLVSPSISRSSSPSAHASNTASDIFSTCDSLMISRSPSRSALLSNASTDNFIAGCSRRISPSPSHVEQASNASTSICASASNLKAGLPDPLHMELFAPAHPTSSTTAAKNVYKTSFVKRQASAARGKRIADAKRAKRANWLKRRI